MYRLLLVAIVVSGCIFPRQYSQPLCSSTSEQITRPKQVAEEIVDLYSRYLLTFRSSSDQQKDNKISIEELKNLEQQTSAALKTIKTEEIYRDGLEKLHYKLKSFISYLVIARQHELRTLTELRASVSKEDPNKQQPIKDEISRRENAYLTSLEDDLVGMFAKQLRGIRSRDLDISQSNDTFFKQVSQENYQLTTPTTDDHRQLFQALLTKTTAITEQTIARYQAMFPIEPTDPRSFCKKGAHQSTCKKISLKASTEPEFIYHDIDELTKLINSYIHKFNKIFIDLHQIQQSVDMYVNEKDRAKAKQNKLQKITQEYRSIITRATRLGVMPLFFTETFHKASGRTDIDISEVYAVKSKLLKQVTAYTIKQTVVNLKKDLINRWHTLKKQQKTPKEKELYQWLVINEVTTTQVLVENPHHAIAVTTLLNKYQDTTNNPELLTKTRGIAEIIDLSLVGAFFGTMFFKWVDKSTRTGWITWLLKSPMELVKRIFNISDKIFTKFLGRFSVVAAVALLVINIPWVIISKAEYIFARQRYHLAKNSLLAGTSACVISTSKLQRAMQGRKMLLIGSTAALALAVVALPNTLSHGAEAKFLYAGLADALASLGADHELLAMLANLYNSMAAHKNLKIEDQSYQDLITG